jgi:antitoxin component YwqK of YwqJK toxin-antitoxin module
MHPRYPLTITVSRGSHPLPWTFWCADDQKEWEGKYKNGKEEGLWTSWDEDGSIYYPFSGIYKDGKNIAPLPKK